MGNDSRNPVGLDSEIYYPPFFSYTFFHKTIDRVSAKPAGIFFTAIRRLFIFSTVFPFSNTAGPNLHLLFRVIIGDH